MTIGAILSALVKIPQILGYVEEFAKAVTQWYVARQTSQTLGMIADAAAFAARAKSDEERFQAALRWKNALSRERIVS